MYTVPTECPVCHDDLHVTQLVCSNCGTEIRGHFELDHLSQLIPEQRSFIEVFILCEGKLNCVQDELGISYPTVRSRLDEIIRTLKHAATIAAPAPVPSPEPVDTQVNLGRAEIDGYKAPVPSPEPVDTQARQDILGRLAAKEISAEEAMQLLENL